MRRKKTTDQDAAEKQRKNSEECRRRLQFWLKRAETNAWQREEESSGSQVRCTEWASRTHLRQVGAQGLCRPLRQTQHLLAIRRVPHYGILGGCHVSGQQESRVTAEEVLRLHWRAGVGTDPANKPSTPQWKPPNIPLTPQRKQNKNKYASEISVKQTNRQTNKQQATDTSVKNKKISNQHLSETTGRATSAKKLKQKTWYLCSLP